MARLIDADALEAKLEEQRKLYIEMDMKGAEHLLVHDVLHYVWEAPTIDAVPVRHGGWEKNNNLFIDTLYRCSVCGEEFYLENGTPQENQYYYCPNCGAKMDGDADD